MGEDGQETARASGGRTALSRCAGGSGLAMLAAILLVCTSTGCVSLTYQPKATVGLSPEQLPLRVAVRELQDVSPSGDRQRSLGGTAATASDTLVGDLRTALTDSLLENLRNDEVFLEIRRRPEEVDLILSGSVRRFYAKSNLNPLGYVCMLYSPVILLGLPIYTSHGAVDIELYFERPDGRRVATYSASRDFKEYRSIYRSPMMGIGTLLNQRYSEVVSELREQILADRERLVPRSVKVEPESDASEPGPRTVPPDRPNASGRLEAPHEE